MAAVAEFSILLFAFIFSIYAEELFAILKQRASYTFTPSAEDNFCLVSRFVDEQRFVLWNTSGNMSHSYTIHNLTHLDSGLYQEECVTSDHVAYETNTSITVCSTTAETAHVTVSYGETMVQQCQGSSDNVTVQWFKRVKRNQQEMWTPVSADSKTSIVEGRLTISNFTITDFVPYTCLVMEQEQCLTSRQVLLDFDAEYIYRSEGEMVVMHCPITSFRNSHSFSWNIYNSKTVSESLHHHSSNSVGEVTDGQRQQTECPVEQEAYQNYSMTFLELMLWQTGLYTCYSSDTWQNYFLVVCPKLDPPAVQLFSEGDEVTLTCIQKEPEVFSVLWFTKPDMVKNRTFTLVGIYREDPYIREGLRTSMNISSGNKSLILSNVMEEDRGEFWCVALDLKLQCISTTKTLLIYRDPFGIHSTFYIVWSSMLSSLLLLLCVVVAIVTRRTGWFF